MPGNPHPIDVAFATRNATTIGADIKVGYRRSVADLTEVRGTDLSGQYAGIRVLSLQKNYRLDTESVAADDDGESTIIDGAGNHFVIEPVTIDVSERTVTAAGDVTVLSTDAIIYVNKTVGANTDVLLGPSADLEADELLIVDAKGDASTHRIRLTPNGAEKVSRQDYFDITRDDGFARLRKISTGGWRVVGSSE